MLKEIQKTRQITGEPRRRWFSDEVFDLIVWYADPVAPPSHGAPSNGSSSEDAPTDDGPEPDVGWGQPGEGQPDEAHVVGFQLCYREWPDEKALTWLKGKGFSHNRIDQGEGRPDHHKMTPILLPDGEFDAGQVHDRFQAACAEIDPQVAEIVCKALGHYPDPDF
jgi:hypothetical protein